MALTRIRAQQISDIDYKQAVRVITVADVTLSGGAPSTVDGVNLVAGDRILVAGQNTGSQNGLYDVSVLGTGSNGTWVRTADGDVTGEIQAGMIIMVTEGTVYKDTQWKLTTNNPIIIGTTALAFEQNSAYAFGNIYANGTAVLANAVGGTVTLSAGGNVTITGNNTTKTITISATGGGGGGGMTWTTQANTAPASPNAGDFWYDSYNQVKYQYINDGDSDQWVDQSFPTSFSSITANLTISANGNITGGNIRTTGLISATGNATVGNILAAGYFYANGTPFSGGGSSTAITNGTSNVDIASANANVTVSVAGTSNIAVFSTAGVDVTGAMLATGNVDSANLSLSAGNITVQNPTQTPLWMTNESDYISLNSDSYVQLYWTSNIANLDPALGNDGYQWIYIDAQGAHVRTTVGGANIRDWDWNASSGQITSNFDISTTGNVTGGNLDTVGYVNAVGNVSADENIIGGNIITTGLITATGNITGGNLSVGTGTISMGNIVNTNANGVGNIGNSTVYFNTIFAKATSAQYADLAEMYVADQAYEPGTVVIFGGDQEITASTTDHDTAVAGVISTRPSYLMNTGLQGKHVLPVALTGRVPCRVKGPVAKGDVLVTSSVAGTAQKIQNQDRLGCVLGKSLDHIHDDSVQTIEIAIGRF